MPKEGQNPATYYYRAAEAGHREAQKLVPDWREKAKERELRKQMSRWVLTYFGACLGCDTPILEALYFNFQAEPLPPKAERHHCHLQ